MSAPTAHDAALVVALLDEQRRYMSHRIPENRARGQSAALDIATAHAQLVRTAAYRRIAADLRQRFGLEAHG